MAYSTANRPYLVVAAPAGGFGVYSTGGANLPGSSDVGGNIWAYRSTDAMATVIGANYFTDGFRLGMRKGDIIIGTQFSTAYAVSALFMAAVSAVTASSAATAGVLGTSA